MTNRNIVTSAINPYMQSSPFGDGPNYTPQMSVRGRNLGKSMNLFDQVQLPSLTLI